MFEITFDLATFSTNLSFALRKNIAKKKNVAFKIVSKSEVFLVRYPPLRE